VYQRSNTSLTPIQQLYHPGAEESAGFGSAVAVSGDVMLVGAPLENSIVLDTGAAYVFEHDGTEWQLTQRLASETPENTSGTHFGVSVAISGELLFVGSERDDTAAENAGAVQVYRRAPDTSRWAPSELLLSPGAATTDLFGLSIDIDGGTLLIGTHQAICDDPASRCGKVYAWSPYGCLGIPAASEATLVLLAVLLIVVGAKVLRSRATT